MYCRFFLNLLMILMCINKSSFCYRINKEKIHGHSHKDKPHWNDQSGHPMKFCGHDDTLPELNVKNEAHFSPEILKLSAQVSEIWKTLGVHSQDELESLIASKIDSKKRNNGKNTVRKLLSNNINGLKFTQSDTSSDENHAQLDTSSAEILRRFYDEVQVNKNTNVNDVSSENLSHDKKHHKNLDLKHKNNVSSGDSIENIKDKNEHSEDNLKANNKNVTSIKMKEEIVEEEKSPSFYLKADHSDEYMMPTIEELLDDRDIHDIKTVEEPYNENLNHHTSTITEEKEVENVIQPSLIIRSENQHKDKLNKLFPTDNLNIEEKQQENTIQAINWMNEENKESIKKSVPNADKNILEQIQNVEVKEKNRPRKNKKLKKISKRNKKHRTHPSLKKRNKHKKAILKTTAVPEIEKEVKFKIPNKQEDILTVIDANLKVETEETQNPGVSMKRESEEKINDVIQMIKDEDTIATNKPTLNKELKENMLVTMNEIDSNKIIEEIKNPKIELLNEDLKENTQIIAPKKIKKSKKKSKKNKKHHVHPYINERNKYKKQIFKSIVVPETDKDDNLEIPNKQKEILPVIDVELEIKTEETPNLVSSTKPESDEKIHDVIQMIQDEGIIATNKHTLNDELREKMVVQTNEIYSNKDIEENENHNIELLNEQLKKNNEIVVPKKIKKSKKKAKKNKKHHIHPYIKERNKYRKQILKTILVPETEKVVNVELPNKQKEILPVIAAELKMETKETSNLDVSIKSELEEKMIDDNSSMKPESEKKINDVNHSTQKVEVVAIKKSKLNDELEENRSTATNKIDTSKIIEEIENHINPDLNEEIEEIHDRNAVIENIIDQNLGFYNFEHQRNNEENRTKKNKTLKHKKHRTHPILQERNNYKKQGLQTEAVPKTEKEVYLEIPNKENEIFPVIDTKLKIVTEETPNHSASMKPKLEEKINDVLKLTQDGDIVVTNSLKLNEELEENMSKTTSEINSDEVIIEFANSQIDYSNEEPEQIYEDNTPLDLHNQISLEDTSSIFSNEYSTESHENLDVIVQNKKTGKAKKINIANLINISDNSSSDSVNEQKNQRGILFLMHGDNTDILTDLQEFLKKRNNKTLSSVVPESLLVIPK